MNTQLHSAQPHTQVNVPVRLFVFMLMLFFQMQALAQTTVFSENFEGTWPNTWVIGNDTGVTTHKWGNNTAKKSAGTWSGFCADNGSNSAATYPNNLHTTMERQSVSLVGYNTATLSFRCYCNTEYGYDKLTVNVKNGSTWSAPLLTLEGSSGGWQLYSVNLSAYAGLSGLTVQFRFDSDGLTTSEGVWLDDIALTATPAGAISVTVKDLNGNIFTGPASVSRYNSSFALLDSKSTSSGVASWSNVPTGTYNFEVYSNSEFWGAAQTTVTQGNTSNVTIQRSEPYATAFVTKLGSADVTGGSVLAESSLSHEVTVRNATSVSQSARVLLRVDRSQSSAYDFEETSTSQTISSGSTKTFSFSHAPATPGTYYRYLEVQTLVSGSWVKSDTYSWGVPLTVSAYRGDLSITVKKADGSVFTGDAAVFRFDNNYSSIDSKTPSGGNASWSSIPQGTYNLELYSNSELWAKAQVVISGGQTSNVILQRNQPLAESFMTSFGGNDVTGGTVYSNSALTHTIRVRNSAGINRNTKVRLLVDRDTMAPYELDLTSSSQTISNIGSVDFLYPHSPSVAGSYYRQLEVLTEDTPGNWVKTDSYAWGKPLTVISAPAAFYLTRFPLNGVDQNSPIINSVFDHDRAANSITAFSGESASAFIGRYRGVGNEDILKSSANFSLGGTWSGYPSARYMSYDQHNGIDYNGGWATPVFAAHKGTVRVADSDPDGLEGRYVSVVSDDGLYRTYYMHLFSVSVNNNDPVDETTQLGTLGNSGLGKPDGSQEGKHLHFELRKLIAGTWVPLDPYGWAGNSIQADPHPSAVHHPHGGFWKTAVSNSVIGSVRDASGAPLAGVKMVLSFQSQAAAAHMVAATSAMQIETYTDDLGNYRFSNIPSNTAITVSAQSDTVSFPVSSVTFENVAQDQAALFTASANNLAPGIIDQPKSVIVTLGSEATFSVQASGSGPLSFQWRKNSVAIPGATAQVFTIPSVALSDNGSVWDVTASNTAGSVVSSSATLTVNQPPSITGVVARTVKQGTATAAWQIVIADPETAAAALSVTVDSGNEAILPSSGISLSGSGATRSVMATLPQGSAGSVSIVMSVTDSDGATTTSLLPLTIISDSDFDGIPDSVETAAGLNPNDPSDAVLDSDGDGQSNLIEFAAGTDMSNAASSFRVLSFAINQSGLGVSFTSITGKHYRLQFCDDLKVGDWQVTGAEIIGTGGVDTFSVLKPATERRFYRVEVQSDL